MVESFIHMPDYVYALHDFLPEHEDEVSFHAGERIEVLEKDDLYGDGWWQGRNLSGKVGLFPQSYTTPAPPAVDTVVPHSPATDAAPQIKTFLHPLAEESESESLNASSAPPADAPAIHTNGHDPGNENEHRRNGNANLNVGAMGVADGTSRDGEVMKATLTDVQKAIEQLGRRKNDPDGDGSRSFSFASSNRDTETETDTDFEADRDNESVGGEDWHKGARRKLAEKARKAVEEAEKLEMMMSGEPTRNVAPPIEVEVSDESEDEDEDNESQLQAGRYETGRQHPYIPEEDESQEDDGSADDNLRKGGDPHSANSQGDLSLPTRDDSDLPTATAARTSFPVSTLHTPPPPAQELVQDGTKRSSSSMSFLTPRMSSSGIVASSSFTSDSTPQSTAVADVSEIRTATPVSLPISSTTAAQTPPGSRRMSSISSKPLGPRHLTSMQASTPSSLTFIQPVQPAISENKESEKHPPSEWSIDDVVEWLKSKGFDQDVCDKFVEQEITGDVLLELDLDLLKTEIGIMAFGKRKRVANAIADLRRPPSIQYSDHPASPHSPVHRLSNPYSMSTQNQSPTHSRSQSQAVSQSYSYLHGHTQSVQSSGHVSLSTPITPNSAGLFAISPESAPHSGDIPCSPGPIPAQAVNGERDENRTISDGSIVSGSFADAVERAVAGLGIEIPGGLKDRSRPGQLMISPSESALHKITQSPEDGDDEAGAVVSESEAAHVPNRTRSRFFGRSQDSSSNKRASDSSSINVLVRNSKSNPGSPSLNASPTKMQDSAAGVMSRPRGRKSSDTGKSSDRLSLFGTTFSAPLGKSRKPAPRFSTNIPEGPDSDRGSTLSISRLYGGNGSKKKRNSDPDPKDSPTAKDTEFAKEKPSDPALLRKRGSPMPGSLKPGLSMLEQIGEADYSGWMRKRGDRYNNWKQRYFILKGPHLYWLRSSSKTETKIKGYIHIVGYKVIADENANPGRYAFKIVHDSDKTHFFSSDEQVVVREWMKAIMKATIGRDYSKPVMSSCNIPTIPLTVAQAMNPAPRPPSPTARDATQKALRRENPNQLSSRDARILMGLPSPSGELKENERRRLESFFSNEAVADFNEELIARGPMSPQAPPTPAPPRPSRDKRNNDSRSLTSASVADIGLIEWANSHLPSSLQMTDAVDPLCGGLALLRLAESIRGKASSPPVPDSAFPTDVTDDKLDGLFKLFDFLLDNDVKVGSVSINDVRQGKRDKILQLLKALKTWEEKRKVFGQNVGIGRGSIAWN